MSHDSKLQQAVLDEFNWEPSILAAHIGVTAYEGVVTLTGHVESFAQKLAAETAARRVKGVKAVAEELEVRLPASTRLSDEVIAAAAVDRIAWDATIPRDRVFVQVEKGQVRLTGQVDWRYQQEAVEQDVWRLQGVTGVSNQTTIKPKVNTSSLGDDIVHALHRSWFFDPQQVAVSANGGEVRLTGIVHSPHDRTVAAMTAWAAPGTTAVQNDIVIA